MSVSDILAYLQFYRLEYHLTWGGYRPPLDPPYGGLLHGGVPEKSWGGLTPPRGGLEKSLGKVHATPSCCDSSAELSEYGDSTLFCKELINHFVKKAHPFVHNCHAE